VAFINMKPFGQGGLIQVDNSLIRQLDEVLTPEECLQFCLSNPGVTMVIPGPMKVEYLKENVAVASRFKPLSGSQLAGLTARADRLAGGICGACEKPCEPVCPNNIPVSEILSMLEFSYRLHFNKRLQSDQYSLLPRTILDCDRCGECKNACIEKFDTIEMMERTHKVLNEARARRMHLV